MLTLRSLSGLGKKIKSIFSNNEIPEIEIDDFLPKLKTVKSEHLSKIFFGHLMLIIFQKRTCKDDLFLISETKIDSSFSNVLFSIPEHRILQKDRRLLLYARQDLNCKTDQ